MIECRVHSGGVPSRGLTWRTCSEASNNAIEFFDPFALQTTNDYEFFEVNGLRVLCAPTPLFGGGSGRERLWLAAQ